MAYASMSPVPAAAATLAVLLLAAAAPPQRPAGHAICRAAGRGLAGDFTSEFAGVSGEDHRSNLWIGRVSGPLSGALTVTLEPLGDLMATANPVWNVRTRWTVAPAAPDDQSLVADLYGTVNWKTGVLRLSGVVTEGCLKGYEAVARGRFADLDGSGTLQIQPAVALR